MKYLLAIFLVFTTIGAFAQQDSVAQKKLTTSTLREDLKKVTGLADTTKLPSNAKLDSLKAKEQHALDSLKALNNKLTQSEKKVKTVLHEPIDTLNKTTSVIQQKIQHVEDSMKAIASEAMKKLTDAVPDGVQHKVDSLKSKANDLGNKLSGAEKKIESKVDSAKNKVTSAVTKAETNVQNKINEVTREKTKLPGSDKLKAAGMDLPVTTLPDSKIPGVNLDKSIKADIPPIEGVNFNQGVPEMKNTLPNMQVPKIDQLKSDELNKVNGLTSEVKKVDGQLGEAEKYEGELKKIKDGSEAKKLEKDAESKAENLEQVKGLSTEISRAKEVQANQEELLKKYRDKKIIQDDINRKAKSLANDYLSQHAVQLQEAQTQLANSKKPFSNIRGVKDVFRRRSDELERKTFFQRLVPGITFQSHHSTVPSMDVGLQIGYRVSPRLVTGVGGVYCVGFSDKYKYYVNNQGIYGARAYIDFAALKGLFVHAEFEMLKLNFSKMPQTQAGENLKERVYGGYFGLGKKFKITRTIKGSLIGLYRVDYDGKLPSVSKLNVRFGFEYNFRKAKKKLF